MKRKLNENDVPEPAIATGSNKVSSSKPAATFAELGLDARILQAITAHKFAQPTPVQAKAIPLALYGKDILARAKTGSGKTAAYVLPIIQSILHRKANGSNTKVISALILVPTRELAGQVTKVIQSFSLFCGQDVRVENLTRKEDDKVQRARLLDTPDIVVATPGRANILVNAEVLKVDNLAHLIIDEADLVLSYGHDEDLQELAKSIPQGVQTFLMSATLKTDIETLKGMFCQDPTILEMDEEEQNTGTLDQYVVRCGEDEKFLLVYAIFKLQLVKGKCIVFVDDIDRCYRLKLFLEQFGVKSCILNSELPVNSRLHVVEEFNRNVYDIIIASDENEVIGSEEKSRKRRKVEEEEEEEATKQDDDNEDPTTNKPESNNDVDDESKPDTEIDSEPATNNKKKQTHRKPKLDKEYGISRGIDFQNVACVLNFDLPHSSRSYTHRIGRTARANRPGMALSFCVPANLYHKHKPTSIPSSANDEATLARITKSQQKKGNEVKPYAFDMKRLDGFRYRMADALRAVTRIAIREARTREIKQELLKSEKLKRHFEENPEDLKHLRHDGETHAVRVQPHLRHVPDYLLPGGSKAAVQSEGAFNVGFAKSGENRIRKARGFNRSKGRGGKGGRKVDPLKSLNAKRK